MLKVVDHPLIQSELTRLRDRSCPPHAFRTHVRRVASLMVPAVTQGLETEPVPCETPLEVTSGAALVRPIVLAPILRAGIGFFDGFLDLLPAASTARATSSPASETPATGSSERDFLHQSRAGLGQLGPLAAIQRNMRHEGLTFEPVAGVNEAVAAAVDIRIVDLGRVANQHQLRVP